MKQNRFRSKIFWLGIVAIIMFVLGNWGLYDAIGITQTNFQTLINLVFAALASLGVFNNPTDKVEW